jgi:hypothetical protein
MKNARFVAIVFVGILLATAARSTWAQSDPEEKTASEADNAEKLRKAAQNPVASLISVPIQENWNFNTGQADRTQNVLNIQPVIPVTVGND